MPTATASSTAPDMTPTHSAADRSIEYNSRSNGESHVTSRLIWIGVGVVVGVMLAKQIPQARRYLRLESM